jgi:hypothetical protein
VTAALRIAFLTGQSDPCRCALSPKESAFLATLAGEGVELVPTGFPWFGEPAEWRPVPLWRASLANARQYLAARRGRIAAAGLANVWLAQAPRTLLLAGSCGLALLAAIDPRERARAAPPVCLRRGGAAVAGRDRGHTAVLGRRDRLARWLAPAGAPVPHVVEAGHLDYLESPVVRALAREELVRLRAAPVPR